MSKVIWNVSISFSVNKCNTTPHATILFRFFHTHVIAFFKRKLNDRVNYRLNICVLNRNTTILCVTLHTCFMFVLRMPDRKLSFMSSIRRDRANSNSVISGSICPKFIHYRLFRGLAISNFLFNWRFEILNDQACVVTVEMSSLNAGFNWVQHLRVRPAWAIYFSRNHSRDKLIIFLDSILEPRNFLLETRNSKFSSFEDRVSRIKTRGTVNLPLSGTVD